MIRCNRNAADQLLVLLHLDNGWTVALMPEVDGKATGRRYARSSRASRWRRSRLLIRWAEWPSRQGPASSSFRAGEGGHSASHLASHLMSRPSRVRLLLLRRNPPNWASHFPNRISGTLGDAAHGNPPFMGAEMPFHSVHATASRQKIWTRCDPACVPRKARISAGFSPRSCRNVPHYPRPDLLSRHSAATSLRLITPQPFRRCARAICS